MTELLLQTERLVLRQPKLNEAAAVVDYYLRNRDHLAQWEPRRSPEFYTASHWRTLLAENMDELAEGESARFFVFERSTPKRVVGSCNLNNIIRSVFHACHLGYSMDGASQGKGLGAEAVGAVVDFAFDTLGLHRVMANYQPHNERSARLLASLGFEVEGRAPAYLYLDGRWCDHVLTARVATDWLEGSGIDT